MAEQSKKPVGAFVLALLAGIWMVGTSIVIYPWTEATSWMWGHRMISRCFWWGWGRVPWLGLLFGTAVLVGAIAIYLRPHKAQGWGIVILVASAVNFFFGMGGWLASLLGIAGGAWAMAWRPPAGEAR